MTQPLKAQEPPIEEILASIRRMIAHDNAGKTASAASEPAMPTTAIPSADRLTHATAPAAGPAQGGAAAAPPPTLSATHGPDEADRRFGRRTTTPLPTTTPPSASSSAADLAERPIEVAAATLSRPAIRTADLPADVVAAMKAATETKAPAADLSAPAPAAREAERACARGETAEPAPPQQAQPSVLPQLSAQVSPMTEAAVHAAFDALARATVAPSSRTVEEVVHDAVQPMLKAWLDENLPRLVERLVRVEIERIVRGR